MKRALGFDGDLVTDLARHEGQGHRLRVFLPVLMVGACLVFLPAVHASQDKPTVPQVSPAGNSPQVSGSTSADKSIPLSVTAQEQRDLWSKIKAAVLTKSPKRNTVVGGQVLNFSGGAGASLYQNDAMPLPSGIGWGKANLIPDGPLYYLPHPSMRSVAFHLPLNSPKTFRLLAVSDSGEAQELITEPRSVWLKFDLPDNNPVIHYFYSVSENLFMLINSAKLMGYIPTASSSRGHLALVSKEMVPDYSPASLLNIGPAPARLVSHQVLMPHQGLSSREYELIARDLPSSSDEKILLCEWFYLERIVNYNQSCSYSFHLGNHRTHVIDLVLDEPKFGSSSNKLPW